ncbi:AMP-binding protein [Paraglaciecola aquimarina]|uniref:AMP-binding protein n=1 Tax=Paraglaciecola algarum TaxID=3050085 RepID=A0ABS9D5S8_9ALTE|nr:AMP-binding protein [Paraglaciecola sp. G1-23]MCF2948130.1 AMP-binding protein [Paraglaciecola sp. G1-23]
MASLLEQLNSQVNLGHIVLADRQFSLGKLQKRALEIRQQFPHFAKQSIAISYTELIDFVTALMAFDGWCQAIYLCPPNVSPKNILPANIDELVLWPIAEPTSGLNPNPDLASRLQHNASDTNQQLEQATNWYLATSGTTGEPKWCAHTFLSLTSSTKYSEKLLGLRWALLYQAFRFAGLQVVLQALLSGADLVDVTAGEPLAQVKLLQDKHVSAMSGTPSLWRQLLMTNKLAKVPLRHITLGGEIADQAILNQLSKMFPQAKIRHIYASTEAGVGFVVADGQAGFPRAWLNSTELAVSLKISAQEHLLIKSKHQFKQTSVAEYDAQGYMDTQDRVQIKDQRVLFLGRATGVINVGGNKVYPEKVEQVLLQVDEIKQARVYAKKNPVMGALVVAEVVLSAEIETMQFTEIKKQVLKTCKNQLQRFEIPTKIHIVKDIANNPSGKLNRTSN